MLVLSGGLAGACSRVRGRSVLAADNHRAGVRLARSAVMNEKHTIGTVVPPPPTRVLALIL